MSRELSLSQGYVAIVDDEDYERVVAAGRWCAVEDGRTVYARRTFRISGKGTDVRLHRFLTGWHRTDHINGNGLDNRRSNLRPSSEAQNNRNKRVQKNASSGYKGITYMPKVGRWSARIMLDGRRTFLGYYPTAEDAARAYDEAARELHGEFAALNFARPGERSAS